MDLQELVARIDRWKARKEGGGRDVDEIIEESPVELQTSQAPETVWGEHETGAEAEPSLEGALVEGAETPPESMDQEGESIGEEMVAEGDAVEEAPVEEAPVEEAPVEEAPVEEAPVEEAPVEEAPVEEAPVEEAPVEEAPVEEVPEEQPVEGATDLESEVEPYSLAPDDLIEEQLAEDEHPEEAVAVAAGDESAEESPDATTEIAVDDFEEVKEE